MAWGFSRTIPWFQDGYANLQPMVVTQRPGAVLKQPLVAKQHVTRHTEGEQASERSMSTVHQHWAGSRGSRPTKKCDDLAGKMPSLCGWVNIQNWGDSFHPARQIHTESVCTTGKNRLISTIIIIYFCTKYIRLDKNILEKLNQVFLLYSEWFEVDGGL